MPARRGYVYSSTIERSVAYPKVFLRARCKTFHAVVPDILIGGGNPAHISLRFGGKTFEIFDGGHHHFHGDLLMWQKEKRILGYRPGLQWPRDLYRRRQPGGNRRNAGLDGQDFSIGASDDSRPRRAPGRPIRHGCQDPPLCGQPHRKDSRLAKKGESLRDAVPHADLPEFKDSPLYELNHRINANYVYRLLEEEMF